MIAEHQHRTYEVIFTPASECVKHPEARNDERRADLYVAALGHDLDKDTTVTRDAHVAREPGEPLVSLGKYRVSHRRWKRGERDVLPLFKMDSASKTRGHTGKRPAWAANRPGCPML